ncbi:hypothetical protein JXH92_003684 [Salmonella enterica subsp. enterica serovar 4,[5],12:b:-]|nr:hypothetical protein [Salmonella enterica subsp. enterica serovar 4,[5],12:b:-]
MTLKKDADLEGIDLNLPLLEQADQAIRNAQSTGGSLLRIFKGLVDNYYDDIEKHEELSAFALKLHLGLMPAEAQRVRSFLVNRLYFSDTENMNQPPFLEEGDQRLKLFKKGKKQIEIFRKERFNHIIRLQTLPVKQPVTPKPKKEKALPTETKESVNNASVKPQAIGGSISQYVWLTDMMIIEAIRTMKRFATPDEIKQKITLLAIQELYTKAESVDPIVAAKVAANVATALQDDSE